MSSSRQTPDLDITQQNALVLKNKFLVALPTIGDSHFKQSVTYICDHSTEGTMGIIINQPLDSLSLPDVFKQLNLPNAIELPEQYPVMCGGPVKPQRGFLIHTPSEATWNTSMNVTDDIVLTASKDALEAIAIGAAPDNYLFALGFAGWSAGQLEDELKSDCWLMMDADYDILFDCPAEERWHAMYEKAGLNPAFISQGGNA